VRRLPTHPPHSRRLREFLLPKPLSVRFNRAVKELKDGIRSLVRIDFQGHVHKVFRGTAAEERCANEIRILQALEERECPNVPRLLEHHLDELTIVTTNCGRPAPALSKKKANTLFAELEAVYGIRHDDPEPRNITYDDRQGRFCIIDFELSELLPLPGSSEEAKTTPRLRWAACSESGTGGEANDDAWIAVELSPGRGERLEDHGERFLDPHPLLFAVADGIGGGRAGELASRLLLAGMRRKLPALLQAEQPEWAERLRTLVHQGHEDLNAFGQRKDNAHHMGCTLTLVLFYERSVVMAHVGDSRLYLHREGQTKQISKDHTFAFASWKRGELTEHQYRDHPRRSALYDAMGGGHDTLNPLIEEFESQPGDRFLLCTDGLIDGLWERRLAELLAKEGTPEEIRDTLLHKAREGDDQDDATLIVIDFSGGNN